MARWRQNLGGAILTALFGLSAFLAVFTTGLGGTVVVLRAVTPQRTPNPNNEWDGFGDAVDVMIRFAFGFQLSLGVAVICGVTAAKRAAAHWLPDISYERRTGVRLYRGSGGRMACLVPRVRAEQYRPLCRELAAIAGLRPVDEPTITAGRATWDFQRDDLTVSFDWHIWAGVTIVARSPEADLLVATITDRMRTDRQIGCFDSHSSLPLLPVRR